MSGRIFGLGLPEDAVENLMEKGGGKRFRIPRVGSKSDEITIRRRNKRICIEYESGKNTEELASQNNVTQRWIQKILKESNIEIRGGNGKSLTANIKVLHKLGYNKNQIAKKLDISRPTVYAHMKKLGKS